MHGSLSLLSGVNFQVEVSATDRSLIHESCRLVVCQCVSSRNFKNEAGLARVGLLSQTEKTTMVGKTDYIELTHCPIFSLHRRNYELVPGA